MTSFRIKRLLDLRSKCGEYPELENLLKKYKMLMPHLITMVSKIKVLKTQFRARYPQNNRKTVPSTM